MPPSIDLVSVNPVGEERVLQSVNSIWRLPVAPTTIITTTTQK